MNQRNKKQHNSLRRLLPKIFFSKSKNKVNNETSNDVEQEKFRRNLSSKNSYMPIVSSITDIYEAPPEKHIIYENLKPYQDIKIGNKVKSSEDLSKASSSSMLVSEKAITKMLPPKNQNQNIFMYRSSTTNEPESPERYKEGRSLSGPQVPLSPNEANKTISDYVYYHSVENVPTFPIRSSSVGSENLSLNDSEKILHCVGAEIKCSSAQFMITPKKESSVRLNKQQRAKTLSLGPKEKKWLLEPIEQLKPRNYSKQQDSEKPYNYSAPSTPILVVNRNKVPNMPQVHKSVSPYDHVRKSIYQAENTSRYNSLNNFHDRDHYLYSGTNRNIMIDQRPATVGPSRKIIGQNHKSEDKIIKETTRHKVEAFYWQKLKQMKAEEEQHLLEKSLSSNGNASVTINTNMPFKINTEQRSYSLPRGSTFQQYGTIQVVNKPNPKSLFRRDSDINTAGQTSSHIGSFPESEVVLRHPQKNIHRFEEQRSYDNVPMYEGNTKDKVVILKSFRDRIYENTKSYEEKDVINKHSNNKKAVARDTTITVELDSVNNERSQPPARATTWSSAAASAKYLLNGRIKHNSSLSQPLRALYSGSESSSETSAIHRKLQSSIRTDDTRNEDYQSALSDVECGRAPSRGRPSRRDDPRRHTLAGNHHYMHAYHPQQLSALDLEQSMSRGYPQPPNAIFDDDPGIMSEVETASTGFRRGGKQRSSLPVVRTPSKTLERPLGLVFLQFRNETKRALLPNEITSIDTVKALFVRSFPQQLNMHYMDSPLVKIYIHDSSKDMFYELEDKRAHLRDIGDRSVLRLFESVEMGGGGFPGALNVGTVAMPPGAAGCSGPSSWDQDQSYFSEPEMDSEYHHQHIHKTKQKVAPQAYYMGATPPSTLPRGGSLLRTYSPATPPVPADRVKSLPAGPALAQQGSDVYIPSPERTNIRYEDAYYPAYNAPVVAVRNQPPIEEEARLPQGEMVRYREERTEGDRWFGVERQLANLAGLVTALVNDESHGMPGVHKPLHATCAHAAPGGHACAGCVNVTGGPPPAPRLNLDYPYRGQDVGDEYATTMKRPPKLGKDRYQKSVSFEKSVSFSDDPPDMNSPKQHSPIHAADSKPPKPAIKSSTLPRTSSQERDRLKPAPPPKPVGLVGPPPPPGVVQPLEQAVVHISPDLAQCIREAQRDTIDLQMQLRNLRRTVGLHASSLRKMIGDTTQEIHELTEANKRHIDTVYYLEECYRQQMIQLESDLYELEALVERLRGKAANGEVRVNMSDVEQIAMILSRSSRTVADWKANLPILCDKMKRKIAQEMEKLVRKEKLLEEEPERLELALRRCKKLTGTLVTLKRLACVQEQRLPCSDSGRISPVSSLSSSVGCFQLAEENNTDIVPTINSKVSDAGSVDFGHAVAAAMCTLPISAGTEHQRPENALDALLDELQTFAKPPAEKCQRTNGPGNTTAASNACGTLRRLHSYPSGSDTDASPPVRARNQAAAKPPVPERHPELLALVTRRAPPPPPPRTSSKSPLPSPESVRPPICSGGSTQPSSDSGTSRQCLLEQRHLELLKKQQALQNQYARLQQLQRSNNSTSVSSTHEMKKTGSESNLLGKLNLNMTVSGSLTHLAASADSKPALVALFSPPASAEALLEPSPVSSAADKPTADTTSTKVYETDIL